MYSLFKVALYTPPIGAGIPSPTPSKPNPNDLLSAPINKKAPGWSVPRDNLNIQRLGAPDSVTGIRRPFTPVVPNGGTAAGPAITPAQADTAPRTTWKENYDYWAGNPLDPKRPGWMGSTAREGIGPIPGANSYAAGIMPYNDKGEQIFNPRLSKIIPWLQKNLPGLLKSILPYGAGLLGVGMLSNAMRSNQPQINIQQGGQQNLPGLPNVNRITAQGNTFASPYSQ